MPQESLGFVRMVWVCPNCDSKNPGNFRFCRGCGAAQPADVQFQKDDRDELITDVKEIEQARSGADIHCGFCGARNPASAKDCAACGADLATGVKRVTGTVTSFNVTAAPEVACPSCGTLNPPNTLTCKNCGMPMAVKPAAPSPVTAAPRRALPIWIFVVIGLLVLLCIGFAVSRVARTDDVTGTVSSVSWQRSIPILALVAVERQDWLPEVPSGAPVGRCEERVYRISDQPEARSQKVCGTPYTIDRGNGYSEVVQDCQYEVYEDYCSYTAQDWAVVDTLVTSGSSEPPVWPQLSLSGNQRAGEGKQVYEVVFETNQGAIRYEADPDAFQAMRPGTRWLLTINGFGDIVDIQPDN